MKQTEPATVSRPSTARMAPPPALAAELLTLVPIAGLVAVVLGLTVGLVYELL